MMPSITPGRFSSARMASSRPTIQGPRGGRNVPTESSRRLRSASRSSLKRNGSLDWGSVHSATRSSMGRLSTKRAAASSICWPSPAFTCSRSTTSTNTRRCASSSGAGSATGGGVPGVTAAGVVLLRTWRIDTMGRAAPSTSNVKSSAVSVSIGSPLRPSTVTSTVTRSTPERNVGRDGEGVCPPTAETRAQVTTTAPMVRVRGGSMGTPAQATAPAGGFTAPHGRGITPAAVIIPGLVHTDRQRRITVARRQAEPRHGSRVRRRSLRRRLL